MLLALIGAALFVMIAESRRSIKREIRKMSQALADKLTALTAEVTEVKTAEAAAVTALNGIPKLLADAIAGAADDSAAVTAVQGVIDQLKASSGDLAAAVVANTPAAPAAPEAAQDAPPDAPPTA